MPQPQAFVENIAPFFWAIFFVLFVAWKIYSLDGPGGLAIIFFAVAFGPLFIYEVILGGEDFPVFIYSVIAAFVIIAAVFFRGLFKK